MIKTAFAIVLPPLVFLFQNAMENAGGAETSLFEKYGWALVLVLVTNGLQFLATLYLTRNKTVSETNKIDAETIASLIVTIHKIQDTNDSLFSKVQWLRRSVGLLDDLVDLLIKIKFFLQGNPEAKELRQEITEAISAVAAAEKTKLET